MENIKKWYFYIITAALKSNNETIIYIGITTDLNNRYHDHQGSGATTLIKNYTNGIISMHEVPLNLSPMKRYYAEILETLLACIIKYNFKNIKVYGGCYARFDCDLNLEKLLNKFEEIYNYKYEAHFYNYYQQFIATILSPIKIGTNNILLAMPVKLDYDGDFIMWQLKN